MKKVKGTLALVSLGCAKNAVDLQVTAGNLLKSGWELSPDPDRADVCIINTCSFIASAREEAEAEIAAQIPAIPPPTTHSSVENISSCNIFRSPHKNYLPPHFFAPIIPRIHKECKSKMYRYAIGSTRSSRMKRSEREHEAKPTSFKKRTSVDKSAFFVVIPLQNRSAPQVFSKSSRVFRSVGRLIYV